VRVVVGKSLGKVSSRRKDGCLGSLYVANAEVDPEYGQSPSLLGGIKKFVPSRQDQRNSASLPHISSIMAEALTKKQQKALAFKNKQKSKRRGDGELEQPDVPEQDLLNDDDEEVSEKVEKKEKAKKEVAKDVEEGGAEESEKKRGKRKKTAWDDDEEEEEGEKVAKKSKKDIKQRFILFVGELLIAVNGTWLIAGNLGFKTTKDRVEAVFRQALGKSLSPDIADIQAKPHPSDYSPTNPSPARLCAQHLEVSPLLNSQMPIYFNKPSNSTIPT